MFNVRSNAPSPWLYVEPPAAAEVPGFRMNPDGSVRDTPRAAPPGPFGFDPSASPSPSMGTGFHEAMRFAPGNVYPDADLTGLYGFAPPPRHPLQDALDQITKIYAPFARMPSGRFELQGSDTNIVSPSVGQPLSRYALQSQSPMLVTSAPAQSDGALMTVGPWDSSSSGLASPEAETTSPQTSENLPVPDGQESSMPWRPANLPSQLGVEPSVGRTSSDAKPVSLPVSTSGPNQSAVSDSGSSVDPTPAHDTQVAQLPQRAPQQQTPSTNPAPQGAGKLPPSDQRRQVRATTAASRLITWDEIIREPPERIDPRFQQPLPDDWEAAVAKSNSNYLRWTKAAAQKYGIPPELLARLFYKESTYNRNKVSDARAKGIAQLMPIAIKELGLNPNTFDYFDAENSINAGAALLAKYHGEFKDWHKAVAAYNMGNTAVREWFDGHPKYAGPDKEVKATLKHVFRGDPFAFGKKP